MNASSSEKKQPKLSGESNDDKGKRRYPPVKHRVHIKSATDIRRVLSCTINDLRQLRVDPIVASKVVYACQVLLGVFEQHDLAVKIGELEQMIRDSGYARR